MITGDQLLIKQINKSIVLNTIRKKGIISRADLANITGLNKSTVSSLVDELIKDGFVEEEGPGESKGGRKPIMLMINSLAGCVVGIDLDVNYILVILTDILANILWQKRINLKIGEEKEDIIGKIIDLIDEAISNSPKTVKGVLGIGIGVPGITDYKRGIVLKAPNLKWENVELKKIIEEKFHLNVYIDNEANTGAIAEKWFGVGKNARNFVYVSAGIGIGTGIIINNELYRGSFGLAGEMGHMTIDINDHLCSCGNRGCWENYASEKSLFSYIKEKLESGEKDEYLKIDDLDKLDINDIIDIAEKGSSLAKRSIEEISRNLSIGIVNIVNTFNPDLVIVGNTLSGIGDYLLKMIREYIDSKCLVSRYNDVAVEISKLGMLDRAIGAVTLVISELFSYPGL
ncbi:ROK family protein [Thermoanaerobacterium thermosaccharolyticum DSM 571]|uniref:ROK family protein n=1 Tax=Thermoanaerobacterium thermosaccharolyticum (strain ATCC 7956 / DSM 571 / NCIMB 9385 / NCA 3814 / NCTC 13789 / WDCM 00135 / 2032) TaxID=580327 RepID=D9TTQ2_THETC|nr:ROK family transcriptional regulator [Thermoanaerobacterium thermosaccharolyticum]ADL69942.1 ROK family protein [Thermoanaerobacterium thermosaccharolyticum DSM 571]